MARVLVIVVMACLFGSRRCSPCRFVMKRRGCRKGDGCNHCHTCPMKLVSSVIVEEDEDMVEEFDPCLNSACREMTTLRARSLFLAHAGGSVCSMNFEHVRSGDCTVLLKEWLWANDLIGPVARRIDYVVFVDLGNVLTRMRVAELARLDYDFTVSGFKHFAFFICTRGRTPWIEILRDEDLTTFMDICDGVIVTEHLERSNRCSVFPEQRLGMTRKMIYLGNGDKGDAAALFGVPVFLFDDRSENITQVQRKGAFGSDGALVHRPDLRERECQQGDRFQWHTTVLPRDVETWAVLVEEWSKIPR